MDQTSQNGHNSGAAHNNVAPALASSAHHTQNAHNAVDPLKEEISTVLSTLASQISIDPTIIRRLCNELTALRQENATLKQSLAEKGEMIHKLNSAPSGSSQLFLATVDENANLKRRLAEIEHNRRLLSNGKNLPAAPGPQTQGLLQQELDYLKPRVRHLENELQQCRSLLASIASNRPVHDNATQRLNPYPVATPRQIHSPHHAESSPQLLFPPPGQVQMVHQQQQHYPQQMPQGYGQVAYHHSATVPPSPQTQVQMTPVQPPHQHPVRMAEHQQFRPTTGSGEGNQQPTLRIDTTKLSNLHVPKQKQRFDQKTSPDLGSGHAKSSLSTNTPQAQQSPAETLPGPLKRSHPVPTTPKLAAQHEVIDLTVDEEPRRFAKKLRIDTGVLADANAPSSSVRLASPSNAPMSSTHAQPSNTVSQSPITHLPQNDQSTAEPQAVPISQTGQGALTERSPSSLQREELDEGDSLMEFLEQAFVVEKGKKTCFFCNDRHNDDPVAWPTESITVLDDPSMQQMVEHIKDVHHAVWQEVVQMIDNPPIQGGSEGRAGESTGDIDSTVPAPNGDILVE